MLEVDFATIPKCRGKTDDVTSVYHQLVRGLLFISDSAS